MSKNPFDRFGVDVTDPTDWASTKLPRLSELDSLKRCYICKEFFTAPVLTVCHHTFCSQCIRQYLLTNSHCPLCKTELYESSLKRDMLLDEIVTCYKSLRPFLLNLLRENEILVKNEPGVKKTEKEDVNSKATDIEKSENGPSKSNKRPAPVDEDDVIEVLSQGESVPSGSSTPEAQPKKKTKPESQLPALPGKLDQVACPICNKMMSADILQTRHLDDCLSGKTTPPSSNGSHLRKKAGASHGIASFFKKESPVPSSSSSSPSTSNSAFSKAEILQPVGFKESYLKQVEKTNSESVKKLPKLDFQSLSTPKLKEKLAALNLKVQGSRSQLEMRYNQFYVLYNSNLDSSRPVLEKQLKLTLNKWEQLHLAFNTESSTLFSSRASISNRSITSKTFLVREWLQVYHQEFRELIRAARASAKKDKKSKAKNTIDVIEEAEYVEVSKKDDSRPQQEHGSTESKVPQLTPELDMELVDMDFADDIANSLLFGGT